MELKKEKAEDKKKDGEEKGGRNSKFANMKKTLKEGLMVLGTTGLLTAGATAVSGCEDSKGPGVPDAAQDADVEDGGPTDADVVDGDADHDAGPGDADVDIVVDAGDSDVTDADAGPADADADLDGGADADATPMLCPTVEEDEWEGIMYAEGNPWHSSENIGDYVFDYIGPDAVTGGPTFRITCSDGTLVRSNAVFSQFGESIVPVPEDRIQVRYDCDGATVNSTGGKIWVEYAPSGG
jgi:hypothetical protein